MPKPFACGLIAMALIGGAASPAAADMFDGQGPLCSIFRIDCPPRPEPPPPPAAAVEPPAPPAAKDGRRHPRKRVPKAPPATTPTPAETPDKPKP